MDEVCGSPARAGDSALSRWFSSGASWDNQVAVKQGHGLLQR